MVLMSSLAAFWRPMGKKLYVGNLPFNASDESLHEVFSQAGNVESAKIIMDRDTGRSKGFGFVEMSNDQEAADAIHMEHEIRGAGAAACRLRDRQDGQGRRASVPIRDADRLGQSQRT